MNHSIKLSLRILHKSVKSGLVQIFIFTANLRKLQFSSESKKLIIYAIRAPQLSVACGAAGYVVQYC